MPLESLPTELLCEIVETATFVDGETSTNLHDRFSCPEQTELLDLIMQSLATRRDLCLVSQLFYDICAPVLYRSLPVTSARTLKLALRTFMDTQKFRPSNPVGHLVLRFHVAVPSVEEWEVEDDTDTLLRNGL